MNKKNILFTIGIIISILGIVLGLSNYLNEKIDIAYDTMNKKLSSTTSVIEEETTNIEEEVEDLEHYIGYLEIDKINFNRGFYSKNSPLNNVDVNIYVVSDSTYPDITNSNLIIASHSGDAYNSYFNDLVNMEVGDELVITYKNKKYIYVLDNIYTVVKDGTVKIDRDINRRTLTLITCTKGSLRTSQTIYISYLKEIVNT